MKKTFPYIIILFSLISLGTLYHILQANNAVFSCQAEWSEDRISDQGLMLNSHVSVILDTNKMTGVISTNGNIYHNDEAYKIKRNIGFDFLYVGKFIKLKKTHLLITKEDTAPDDYTKYFYFLTDDISFAALTLSKNKDQSFTLYNSHEPILICSP